MSQPVTRGMCCYYSIEIALASGISAETVKKAQRIFEEGKAEQIWEPKNPFGRLSCSVDTWMNSTIDYQEAARDLISRAEKKLPNKGFSNTLVFEKIEIN